MRQKGRERDKIGNCVRENKRYDKEGEMWREKRDWRKKEEERQRNNMKLAENGCQERKIE